MSIDVSQHRRCFPALQNNSSIYFDNAATTQKPKVVIDCVGKHYEKLNSNIHRSDHEHGFKATKKYEGARKIIQNYINAKDPNEIVFTKGATDSINIVAHSFCRSHVGGGDVILISSIEHHANIVPWQIASKIAGARIVPIPLNDNLTVNIELFKQILKSEPVKIVAIQHTSNVTGITQPLKEVITESHKVGVPVLVDGAQAIAHTKIDIQEIDCDFFCFSGHKAFGPTGIGVLYGKKPALIDFEPLWGGGGMISEVAINSSSWADLPHKLEAGTPNIAGAIGLGAALQFVQTVGLKNIENWENKLGRYLYSKLKSVRGIILYNFNSNSIPIFSFNITGVHHSDLSALLNERGVSVRSGHLCAQPLMTHLKINGCLRVSLSFYNTFEEIDTFINHLRSVSSFLIKNG